ncbi:Protein-tyrosine-phosphatase IBR5 [Hirschfeldia incana]|nr:Protein-tyrosine-phosphatase IBR5 [Hirschfeldia incana]
MRKRERENPCSLCGHYHKYEEGEVCGICGHRKPDSSDVAAPQVHVSAFPTEILPEFLYLGSYDNASRSEVLKTQGISRVLNTVPMCQNLYRNSFTYHCLSDEKVLQFDDAIKFLDQCDKDKARVLVHCMSGKSRSPAVVIAYLMKRKGWRLAESHQWVKQRRPTTDITPEFYQQLEAFEQTILGSREGMMAAMNINDPPTFGFGFPKVNNNTSQAQVPVFNNASASSIFSSPASSIIPQGFTFGAAPPKPTGDDTVMGGS